jgi:hypothetical protein
MANSYVITSYVTQGNNVYVGATVNGTPVNISFSTSQTFGSVVAFENFIAPLLLAAVPLPVVTTVVPLAVSFTI